MVSSVRDQLAGSVLSGEENFLMKLIATRFVGSVLAALTANTG
jgi:hypothetical protein